MSPTVERHGAARRTRRLVQAAALGAAMLAACAPAPRSAPVVADPGAPAGYVVMVSFDGFRHDYLDRGLTPVLDSLARAGTRADGLVPVMPRPTTKTVFVCLLQTGVPVVLMATWQMLRANRSTMWIRWMPVTISRLLLRSRLPGMMQTAVN